MSEYIMILILLNQRMFSFSPEVPQGQVFSCRGMVLFISEMILKSCSIRRLTFTKMQFYSSLGSFVCSTRQNLCAIIREISLL